MIRIQIYNLLNDIYTERMLNRIYIRKQVEENINFKTTGAYRKIMHEDEILCKVKRLLEEYNKIQTMDCY